MKSIKTRLVSAFLLIMTILSLFPTTAFAASSTGKGITITKNQNYWSTRLLANGTPYSYRPRSWTVSSCTAWIAASAIITQRLRT